MLRTVNRTTNFLQTVGLILAMAGLVGAVGFTLGGTTGFIAAVLLSLFWIAAGQRVSASIVLRMYKARPLLPQQAPGLFAMYSELCRRAGLSSTPDLYYIPSRMANAFAVGSGDSSAIALTDGIIRMMNPRELAGILGHEITHVRCRDTSVLGVADTFSRTVAFLSRLGLFMMLFSFPSMQSRSGFLFLMTGVILFFSPAVATMLQLALSRTREFNADRGAAELTGDPIGLASALKKLDRLIQKEGLFQKILRPGMRRQQPAMLRTHPPTEDRVSELMEMATDLEEQARDLASELFPDSNHVPISGHSRVQSKPRYHVMSGLWH
jgi:heat shock protein HtpX